MGAVAPIAAKDVEHATMLCHAVAPALQAFPWQALLQSTEFQFLSSLSPPIICLRFQQCGQYGDACMSNDEGLSK